MYSFLITFFLQFFPELFVYNFMSRLLPDLAYWEKKGTHADPVWSRVSCEQQSQNHLHRTEPYLKAKQAMINTEHAEPVPTCLWYLEH